MMYLFALAIIIVTIVTKVIFKWQGSLGILLGTTIAYLLLRGPEPYYRIFFALGSVTDLIIRIALGALIVELLKKGGVLKAILFLIESKIKIKYLQALCIAFLAGLPSLISGSFLVGMTALKELWPLQEKRGFLRAALLLGVLAPPFNPYLELLILGRGWEINLDMLALGLPILLFFVLIPLLPHPPKAGLKLTSVSNKAVASILLTLLFLIWELALKNLFPQIAPPSVMTTTFLFLALLGLNFKAKAALEKGLTSAIPAMTLILSGGFLISLAAVAGYRGMMVLKLLEFEGTTEILILMLGALILGVVSPVMGIALLGVPMVVDSAPSSHIIVSFVLITVTSGYFGAFLKGIEGEDASIMGFKGYAWGLLLLVFAFLMSLDILPFLGG